jgi:predicted AAA+ superfamily ATPase
MRRMKTMATIIGRGKEKDILKQVLKSVKPEFLALIGRRRVGKTFLIKNFFEEEDCVFFYCAGQQQGTLKQHLEEFSMQIGKTFYSGATIKVHTYWREAFEELTKAVEKIITRKKVVLFFDELPWMATKRSGLLQALDYYWNRYWSHEKNLRLIVCGSSASWITKNIINNKGGLYNRLTRTMNLEPFTLKETEDFLTSLKIKLNHKQILDLYMTLGGVPHYLALIRKGLSAYQCIDELCFQKGGALIKEFSRLFASLFNEAEAYITLIRVIAKHHYGIGQAQLIQESGASDGGRTVQRLKELEEAGFILEFIPYGHQEKGVYYKVIDEFTLFHLRWMEPNLKTILKQERSGGYWLAKTKSPSWKSWAGYAFESVCYKHIAQIRKALNIDAGAEVGSWRYSPRTSEKKGTQIDLLFDRTDGVITVCEIKYSDQPFIIDKSYANNLLSKIDIYRKQSRTTKLIFLSIISANGIKPTMYSEELINGGVALIDDLFEPVMR